MTKRIILYTLLLALLLPACSHKKTEAEAPVTDTVPMMVMQIQKCSRLYTTQYQIHKIVTHDDQKSLSGSFMSHDFKIDLPMSRRRVAIPIDATVKAYIDFNNFSEDNIRRHGNKIEVILPDPKIEITSTKVNHQEIKEYVGLMRSRFSDEELTTYEQQGRAAIEKSLPETHIIESARQSAARTLIPIIEQMGYKAEDITVTFRKDFTLDDIRTMIQQKVSHGK